MPNWLANNEGTKVTLQGVGVNILLAAGKFVGGVLGKSTALIADSIHSLSDLLTDVVVLFSHQIGRMPRDEGHPYGHGRAETIGAVIISSSIILVALGLAYEVWDIIASGKMTTPEWPAAMAAALSILAKETLFHYSRKVGEKIHSPAIVANAWHHRSDAVSSIACLIGVLGAMQGYPILDPLAGGAVALMIGKMGIDLFIKAMRDLMDSALDKEQTERIKQIIASTPGVRGSHDLRTRRIGGEILIDVHILVAPEISVTEGHDISENVRHKLKQAFTDAQDVLVHVDAEDDMEKEAPYLMTREELEVLTAPIIASTQGIERSTQIRVHYLDGQNIVEIFVRVNENKTLDEIKKILTDLKTRLEALDRIDGAKVYLDVDAA
ncbi:MAG: cation diffusion facilitator family transporter [Nitrospinales bacterium]